MTTLAQIKEAQKNHKEESEHMKDMLDVFEESPKYILFTARFMDTFSKQGKFVLSALLAMAED